MKFTAKDWFIALFPLLLAIAFILVGFPPAFYYMDMWKDYWRH